MVDLQPLSGRFHGAGQRRGLLPYVRRKPLVGLFRPSADDGAAGLAWGASLRRGVRRAVFLYPAAAALPLCLLAHHPAHRCRPPRCGAFRHALGRDAHVAVVRFYRRARRSADDDRGVVPAHLQMVHRRAARGVALDGCGHGADGLQQVPRGAGGALRACGDPPPRVPASDPISQRRGGAVAARAAFRVAVRARLGVAGLSSGGA